MATKAGDSSTIDMNQLLLEVLNSNSSFGAEMRGKISSALDVATKKIEKGVGAMKFDTEPVNIVDIINVDEDQKKKAAATLKTQQDKMLKWIKEVAMASNWKNLSKGVNITDLLGADKLQNERFAKQYAELQRKILAAAKTNIPTKQKEIADVATSKGVKQPTPETPKEVANKPEPKFGIAGNEKLGPMLMPPINPMMQRVLEDEMGTEASTGAKPKTEGVEKTNSLLTSILEKINALAKSGGGTDTTGIGIGGDASSGGMAGREAFQEKEGILISEFGPTALEQLTKALPGKDKKEVKKAAEEPKKDKPWWQTALEFAGIGLLVGILTYLATNEEALKKVKEWVRDSFIPWLKSLPEKWEDIKTNFGIARDTVLDVVKNIKASFSNIGKAAKGELVDIEAEGWWNKWIITPFLVLGQGLGIALENLYTNYIEPYVIEPFIKFGKAIGEGAWMITQWVDENVIQPFITFGKAVGEGAWMITQWIDENVIQPFITFGKAVGEGAAIITQWIQDKVFTPIKDFATTVWDGVKNMVDTIKNTILAIPKFIEDAFAALKKAFTDKLSWLFGDSENPQEKVKKVEEQIATEEARVRRSKAGKNEYYGNETSGQKESEDKIKDLKATLIELNKAAKNADTANDFIWRSGQGIQKISEGDTVIGAKDKIVVENKNLDVQMQNLTSVMKTIQGKFDALIDLNSQMLRSGKFSVKPEPLPPIANDIHTSRSIASDEALLHKTRVWQILHGVT